LRSLMLSRSSLEELNIRMADIIEAVERGCRRKGEGKVSMPAKIGIHPRKDCFIHAMPCYIGGEVDASGIKWVAGYPSNQEKGLPYISGIMCLNESDTGLVKAIMDASWITAYRTGAASAVCAKYLGNPDSKVIAVIGLGVQGRMNLMALMEVFKEVRQVRVYDVFPSQIERYIKDMSSLFRQCQFVACDSPKEAVEDADVVVTCTPIVECPKRYIRAECLKEDVLAIAVDYDSSFCAPVMAEADVFVCDDTGQYLWTQEQGVYFQDGYPTKDKIYADMGELCAGLKTPVRKGRRGAVLMGIASHDVMTAQLAYEKALDKGIGQWIEI